VSTSERRQPLLGVFLRGMLMGAADIVPGVSGGTMAFITGIYDRLLNAIASFDLTLLPLLRERQWGEIWKHVDGKFLSALLAGILFSVFSLAALISRLLNEYPLLLWSFFFGLILASAIMLLRRVQRWVPASLVGLVLGAAGAAAIGLLPALSLSPTLPAFFMAGFLAICAMILPGVSGSFILLLLGMYEPVLNAIEGLRWTALLLFSVGAATGLLAFSRLLTYLLRVHHSATLATLTGFLVGSLLIVWPWKLSSGGGLDLPVLPTTFAKVTGDSQLLLCIALMLFGLAAVWLLEHHWGRREH
jgi:putative membrane protein